MTSQAVHMPVINSKIIIIGNVSENNYWMGVVQTWQQ